MFRATPSNQKSACRALVLTALTSVAALAASPCSAVVLEPFKLEKRVLLGDPVSGLPAGSVVGDINNEVTLDSAGNVIFGAAISNGGTSSGAGLFAEVGGSITPIFNINSSVIAPGTGGRRFSWIEDYSYNDTGLAFINARISDGRFGIFGKLGGALFPLALEDETAPNMPAGYVFGDSFSRVAMNNSAQIAFTAEIITPGTSQAIYQGLPAFISPLVKTGDPVPGASNGELMLYFDPPVMNDLGQIAFRSEFEPSGFFQGIFKQSNGTLVNVAKTGDPAPGTSDGAKFYQFSTPGFNNAGQTVFFAKFGTNVSGSRDTAVYVERNGGLQLVIREGDQAPDCDPGVRIFEAGNTYIDGTGQVVFRAKLQHSGISPHFEQAIFAERDGDVRLLARQGDPVPGTNGAITFTNEFGNPIMNNKGQIAFFASISGPGITGSNNRGVFATDLDGVLHTIALGGDFIDVNDDPLIEDLRQIRYPNISQGSGGEDGVVSSFNDNGQLVLSILFFDNSDGLFVVTVPEPTTAFFFGALGLCLLRSRR